MLHDVVVTVGIDAQMRDLAFTVSEDFREDALFHAVCGDPVDRAVGGVGQPGAVFDMGIGSIFPDDKGEHTVDCMGIAAEMELSFLYIFKEQFSMRIAVRPLGIVAVLCHKSSGVFVDIQYFR